jgi:hypothetical protein
MKKLLGLTRNHANSLPTADIFRHFFLYIFILYIFQMVISDKNRLYRCFLLPGIRNLLEKFKSINPVFVGFFNFLIYNTKQVSILFKKINPARQPL